MLVQKSATGALGDAVLVQKSIKGTLVRLCWQSRTLKERCGVCVGTVEYYGNTREALLVQKSATGALRDAVLVQKSTLGTLVRLCWQSRAL